MKELAFSVVQGAGKGCTIGQDRLVGFKDDRFNQKYETIENLPNRQHHRVTYYPNSPRKQVLLCPVSNHANYHRCQRKIRLYQKALHMALLNGRHITNRIEQTKIFGLASFFNHVIYLGVQLHY
jgi:hypothetical protein